MQLCLAEERLLASCEGVEVMEDVCSSRIYKRTPVGMCYTVRQCFTTCDITSGVAKGGPGPYQLLIMPYHSSPDKAMTQLVGKKKLCG